VKYVIKSAGVENSQSIFPLEVRTKDNETVILRMMEDDANKFQKAPVFGLTVGRYTEFLDDLLMLRFVCD
jgi:hypothetical protein